MARPFASDRRNSIDEIGRESAVVGAAPFVQPLIDAMPSPVLVLDARRQVVAANPAALGMLGLSLDEVLGHRTGEVFGCLNWRSGPGGCGTAAHCRNCGALHAIQAAQNDGEPITKTWDLSVEQPIR